MTFNIFTSKHKHKLTPGGWGKRIQYLWLLLNVQAMAACTRWVWYIEFHVLWNGVWNVRFVFRLWIAHTTPPTHSLSFGDRHIQLTNVQYMAMLHYYPILSTACRADGTSHVIWGCFLLVSVLHWKCTCWGDFLSINFPYLLVKCYSSHYGWLGSSLH